MQKLPKVKFYKQGLAENRYHSNGKVWAAANLIQWCKEKKYPVFDLPLAGIDLSYLPWNDLSNVKRVAWHFRRALNANLSYPVILDERGYIADGWHRVLKALLLNKRSIKAIRIQEMPLPDGYENDEK